MTDERTLQVEIVTPDGRCYAGEVAMVVLPGVDGELGVLPRHQPLVTLLAIGETRVRTVTDDWDYIATGIGYAQVLLRQGARRRRPRRARRRHRHRPRGGGGAPCPRAPAGAWRRSRRQAVSDYFRAEQALKRAENRLNVARRTH